MKIVFFVIFVAGGGGAKAPRGMPEAVAVDPESISPRGGMATPFSPDLMFSTLDLAVPEIKFLDLGKIKSGLNRVAMAPFAAILGAN